VFGRGSGGHVVIYDGPTLVRIDPAALPAAPASIQYTAPAPSARTTLGALRDWCEPTDDYEPSAGRLCGVVLDPHQAWWTLGQILGPVPDDTRVGLARTSIKDVPAVAITGEGWDVLIAGLVTTLDPVQAAGVPAVRLDARRVLHMVRGGAS